ncbi:hypothetical protein [Thermoproteus uzoniensis]|uniref:hypothetical protein n=1 Tax=Thermoproteus uzoniensis TaxID=184117 RepID=UPI0013053E55|nr:hypothetical protein [Thermoproteus uzoniensis]
MDPPDAAYLIPFDVKTFARPIFFARALRGEDLPLCLIDSVRRSGTTRSLAN